MRKTVITISCQHACSWHPESIHSNRYSGCHRARNSAGMTDAVGRLKFVNCY
jgi:hypothetical protein